MYEFLLIIAVVFLFLGIILMFIYNGLNLNNKSIKNNNIQTGGLIMIGPIPIIFGNSSPMIIISIALGIILFIIAIIFFFFIRK